MHYFEREDSLNRYLSYAVAVHIMVLLLFIGLNILFVFQPLKIEIKEKKEINVIKTAVRVDVVGLPRHTLKELEKINLAAVNAEDTKDEASKGENNETSKVEFKQTKKKLDMQSLLKGYSTKKVVKAKKRTNLKVNNLKNIILEGNKISQGSSTTGDMIDEAQADFIRYVQALPDRVRPNWKLPSYLMEKDLRCRIRVYIAANGKLTKIEMYESSGDSEYDQKAIQAVKNSSPFPKPESKILSQVVAGDVILGFPL